MKLKTIFVIFNVIVLVSFLFVFLLPIFFLGANYAQVFWADNWYLALLFVAVLGLLNAYFILNWKLFNALEKEEWSSVISVLEERLYKKSRWTSGNIRLLVNAYVVTGNAEKISALENHIRSERPNLLSRVALLLGIPHLLANDGERLGVFFSEFRGKGPKSNQRWIEWYYGFALMLQQNGEQAKSVLMPLAAGEKRDLPAVLAAYLLEAFRKQEDVQAVVGRTRNRVRDAYGRNQWDRIVSRYRSELHVLVLTRLLDEVTDWLFSDSSDPLSTTGDGSPDSSDQNEPKNQDSDSNS